MERNIFSNNTPKFRTTKWLFFLVVVSALVLFIWFYLPYALSDHIKKLLIESGHEEVEIGEFNFHPFSGRIIASKIKFSSKGQYKVAMQFLSVKLSWLPLMDKQILINNIFIKEAQISIEDFAQLHESNFADIAFVKAMEKLFPAQISNRFELNLLEIYKTTIETSHAGIDTYYYMDQMSVKDIFCCDTQGSTTVDFKGRVNDTPFNFAGKVLISEQTTTLSGKASTSGLSLANYSDQFNHWFTAIDAKIYLDSEVNINFNDDNINVKQNGSLTLEKLFAENKKVHIVDEQLKWKGQSDIILDKNFSLVSLSANGRILSKEFYAIISQHNINAEFESLQWQGHVNSKTNNNGEYDTNASGEFTVKDLNLSDIKNNLVLLATPHIAVTGFKFNPSNTIEVTDISINNAAIGRPTTASKFTAYKQEDVFWRSDEIRIKNWKLLDLSNLSITNITAKNNNFRLRRLENKTWLLFDSLLLAGNGHEENNTSALSLLIKQLELSSKNTLHIRDEAVSPPYETSIELSETTINEIVSTDPAKYIRIKLAGQFDNQAKLVLTGKTQAFSRANNFMFEGAIRNFPLNSISTYTSINTDYIIKNGQLDGKFSLKSIDNKFNGNTRFFFSDLQVDKVANKNISGFQKNLGISFDQALKYLNNNKKQFKTLLNIKGELRHANFSFSETYFNALGKQLRKKTLLQVKKLFHPYNKSIGITRAKANQTSKIRLQPISFTPGNTLLNVTAIEYLDKIISVLTKRADMTVSLCGNASRLDRTIFNRVLTGSGPTRGLKKAHIKLAKLYLKSISGRKGQNVNSLLYQLSKDRVIIAKNYLLSQRAIDKGQIKYCKPTIDNSRVSRSRVDLLI